ncbi:MAG: hypothetical protein ABEK17_00065 [Candidatus Aenigmatarchaeota archaeon]
MDDKIKATLPIIFCISLIVISSSAKAVSIGTAPGVMNIGELERGKEFSIDFYLLTNSGSPILASLKYNEAKRNLYEENHTGKYTFIPSQASEEDTSEWVNFLRKELVVDPDKSTVIRYPGGVVNADQTATFKIDVPSDAEPGYHAFEVNVNPKMSGTGEGTGVSTIGVTRPVFIFRVPGNVERSGVIEGLAATRESGKARIDVLFRNTGTVTVDARVSSLKVYNATGYYQETLKGGYVKVPPKKTKILKVYWADENRDEEKKRKVEATVDFTTGMASKEGMVNIPKETAETRAKTPEPRTGFPWWLVVVMVGFGFLVFYYWW